MEQNKILTIFAHRFVNRAFKERFIHEAMKKPIMLHQRICHEIDKVFDAKYQAKSTSFTDDDACFFLGWFSDFKIITWKEAKQIMSDGGGGYLVIKADASAFYAETEAYPAITYAGHS